jgi:hypothetical protein
MAEFAVDATPKAKFFRERIGTTEYELREEKLDVLSDVTLWDRNPRLIPLITDGIESEEQLEVHLKRTPGYDALAKSIADIGQLEPVYVWKRDDQEKYLVIEGATRVTIKRELARRSAGRPDETKHRMVVAKVLPPVFSEEERIILLAKIHVRGTGVRSWGRYVEAKFIYEAVVAKGNGKPMMSMSELANHMGKSISWVSRLKDAYEFASRFVEHVDSDDAKQMAQRDFSVLEEIAKSAGVGPMVRDYGNSEHDALRSDVFEMVKNGAFTEYRDARFMKQYHDDPEKWELLKTGEPGIAHKLANDIKAGSTSIKGKIEALPGQIERALERDRQALDDSDIETLRKAVGVAGSYLNPGVDQFRLELNAFTKALESASLGEIKAVQREEIENFEEALDDFRTRLDKHKAWN